MEPQKAAEAIKSFLGAERRFQFWVKQDGPQGKVLIDDYAHHPDELKQSIASVKALYPGRKLTVAFQPHLYSRTRDFYKEFGAALSQADDVIILNIYPARELPIEGVTSQLIADYVTCKSKMVISKEDLPNVIKNRNFEILLTVGAGDINNFLPEISRNILNNK
jgi:UDP-N-acetylmuramate--alanine ligase